jgi:hypothetical protein
MKRSVKKLSRKSFDQILHEKVLALSDRVREDDRRLATLSRRREQRIRKRLLGSNWTLPKLFGSFLEVWEGGGLSQLLHFSRLNGPQCSC